MYTINIQIVSANANEHAAAKSKILSNTNLLLIKEDLLTNSLVFQSPKQVTIDEL